MQDMVRIITVTLDYDTSLQACKLFGQYTGMICSGDQASPIHLQLRVEGQQPHCDGSSGLVQVVAITKDCPQAPTLIGAQPVVKDDWEAKGKA